MNVKYKKNPIGITLVLLRTLFMIAMIAICTYPFLYVLNCSLSDSNYLVGNRGAMLLPKGFSTQAYSAVFNNPNIFSGFKVTLFVLIVGTLLNVLMTAIGAFLVSRKNFALAKPMMKMMLITMYFGGGMIPTYLVVSQTLGLRDSVWSMILPSLISVYNLIVMKTSFLAIPDSLEESAKLDGASDILILFKIIIPLSLPTVAVMFLFYGVGHWNAWFSALLYIDTREKFPLQMILREILLLNGTQSMMEGAQRADSVNIAESIRYATIIVVTAPILVVYPFIQKYFVSGMMIGAVKG